MALIFILWLYVAFPVFDQQAGLATQSSPSLTQHREGTADQRGNL